MNTFQIQYQQQDLQVTEQENDHFTVDLPEGKIYLLLKQDNEGANHWFEDGKDKETEKSKAVGLAIERYLNNKQ
ncbi:hypothetical protein F0L74_08640 [Chitinophaga agrisoli]|uniref:Uncharacterized protein n=1 Tax=Chitinophaga agrisoli TaxID=2607653 RepID=A0A5B2VS52_9BACT|nr:hypothetical protein [Chitinophaga agrisoli]KAA2242593.1 hypothetical protein F0L74_08640 [Chitinophaga agrisoli]